MKKELAEQWAKENYMELKAIVRVLDVAFKYAGHNCRLTHEQCKKLAKAHDKIKPLKAELTPCPICKKPRGKEENGAYICPCPHCGDDTPF